MIKVTPSGPSDPSDPTIDPLKPSGPDSDDPNKPSHIDEKHEIKIVYIFDEQQLSIYQIKL